MTDKPIKLLFTNYVDVDNFNAQSLNIREIIVRLPADHFQCTCFYRHTPDPRLLGRPNLHLKKVPARFGTIASLAEGLCGYDILFNPPLGTRFTSISLRLPSFLRPSIRLLWLEGILRGNIGSLPEDDQRRMLVMLKHIDVFIAITEYVAETSARDYGIRAKQVIPVGVDIGLFKPYTRPVRDRATVLFIGHIIERKGPQLVLEAARLRPDADYLIVGEDRYGYLNKLKEIAATYGLNNVTFIPPMSQQQLVTLMHKSDILLLPSRVEGLPKVVLEAAATGLPTIIFDDYQAPVVVNGKTGYQVSTLEEMNDRLGQLIDDPVRRQTMGKAASIHARSFSWDDTVAQWEALLAKILE